MKREDGVVLVASLVVFALVMAWVYTTNVAEMAPHKEYLWIQTCFNTTDYASGVNMTQMVTRNSGILYYAGHYDLSIDKDERGNFIYGNYTIYSEGEPGWLYRKITKVETLTPSAMAAILSPT